MPLRNYVFCFRTNRFTKMKRTTRIAGKMTINCNVCCGPAVSIDLPIIGNTMEVATIPAPPITDNPSAPLFGTYSEMNPSMVGQK